jgi:hypothetical protein
MANNIEEYSKTDIYFAKKIPIIKGVTNSGITIFCAND